MDANRIPRQHSNGAHKYMGATMDSCLAIVPSVSVLQYINVAQLATLNFHHHTEK